MKPLRLGRDRPPRPGPTARAAGGCWSAKCLAGPDEHQVRCWTSWHRWITLAMLARAFLAVAAATERRDHPAPDDLAPLTCYEIQHLFTTLIARPAHDALHRLRWS